MHIAFFWDLFLFFGCISCRDNDMCIGPHIQKRNLTICSFDRCLSCFDFVFSFWFFGCCARFPYSCVCVYVHMCIRVFMRVLCAYGAVLIFIFVQHLQIYTHTYTYVFMYICVNQLCTPGARCVYMHIHVYVRRSICAPICLYIHVCIIYIYTYTCTYMYVRIHILVYCDIPGARSIHLHIHVCVRRSICAPICI